MPIYTYRCESCGVQFERNQKFSDTPLTRCPECGKKSLRKVYLPVGIVFKGSGFYSTDHRSPSGGGGRGGSSHSEEKSEEKSTSETKPVSKDSGSGESTSTSSEGK
jgi:putative FmdB family regulatory protein